MEQFLYRAINKGDKYNIDKNKAIISSDPESFKNLEEAIRLSSRHIAVGSKENFKDNLISTTKNFNTCVKEFSIPQMGGYNTAMEVKPVVIIRRDKICGINKKNYNFNGNFTYINNTDQYIDVGDGDILGRLNNRYTKFNGKERKISTKLILEQLHCLKRILNSEKDINKAICIFDMAFPSRSMRGNSLRPLNEFSFYDYIDYDIVDRCQGTPIASGSVTGKDEVLILNRIDENCLKELSTIERDVIFALEDENEQNKLINRIFDKKLKISIKKNFVIIEDNGVKKAISLSKNEELRLNNFLVDIVKEKNNGSVEDTFNILKEEKRKVIKKILNSLDLKSERINIVEDGAIVLDARKDDYMGNINDSSKYDILLIQTDDEICDYREEEYVGIYNDIIKSKMKTK